MARYIARSCPRCRDYLRVTISHLAPESRELSISARCNDCGYALEGWRVIVRPKQQPEVRVGRMRKVFKQ